MRFDDRPGDANHHRHPSRLNERHHRLGYRWTIRGRGPGSRDRLRGPFLGRGLPAPSCARNHRRPPNAVPATHCHGPHRQRGTLSARSSARHVPAPGALLQLPDLGPGRHDACSSTPDHAHDCHLCSAPPAARSTRVRFRLTRSRSWSPPRTDRHRQSTTDSSITRSLSAALPRSLHRHDAKLAHPRQVVLNSEGRDEPFERPDAQRGFVRSAV